jgi:hypothetical protein
MTPKSEQINTREKELYKEPDGKLEGSEIEKLASFFEILRRIDQRQKRNGKNN